MTKFRSLLRSPLTGGAIALLGVGLALSGCEEGPGTKQESYRVVCHSGGEVILDDLSSTPMQDSYSYTSYESVTTGSKVYMSGDCIAYQGKIREG